MAEPHAVPGFAGLLRHLRVGAGLTQEELAEAAGLSPRSVSDLERGINRTARKETARLLADALNLAGPARAAFEAAARGRAPADGFLPQDMLRGEGVASRTLSGDVAALAGGDSQVIARLADLRRVLDWSPPDPAERGEITVYLKTLIDWLSTDPWPRDPQFGGPVLTPAAIERKLQVTATGRAAEQDLDADDLARQCRRLVVLGGPGSGKTWLAKRTARRCAEEALEALAGGGTLDEVELPLYTTCSRLFAADGDIRQAVVSSALDQLSDLGGSRISAALRALFTARNTPTLLVIDSLDEARGSGDRLRQARTLPWRIVLTSRPTSWNQQLDIEDGNDSDRVGELQPLRYPDDVEPFIHRWFARQPEWGTDLAAQLARRPGLQQAATVPLVLAFYCIVGGREPLPDFRRDLYVKVINRMLTGRWRGGDDRRPDSGNCLQALRAWAWPGADAGHPVSGVGTWADDILTERVRLADVDQHALDHIAAPLGPPDVDTGKTLRRFIHRSIREHLVAEHVAGLPAGQAAQVLLPHLWYDPDWEYCAPAAAAMHPQHDQLLRELICRAARSDQIPEDLSVIDAGWEFRGFLARVVSESSEASWLPEIAGMIGKARAELARAVRIDDLSGAALWGTSNGQVREVLLRLLADPANGWAAEKLVGGLVQLAASAEESRQALEALLGLLAGQTHGHEAAQLVDRVAAGVVQLAATAQDKRQAREALLKLLAGQIDGQVAEKLVGGLVQLAPMAEDNRQALEALLGLLSCHTHGPEAARLVGTVIQLAVAAEDKRQVRDVLLRLLAGQPDGWVAAELMAGVVQLAATAEDKRQYSDALAGLLAGQPDRSVAARLPSGVGQPGLTAEEKRPASETLLGLLAGETNGKIAAGLAGGLIQLDLTAEDRRCACAALLELLDGETNCRTAAELAGCVSRLSPTAEDKRRACAALLRLLADQISGYEAAWLGGAVIQLDPTAKSQVQARAVLLRLLAGQADGPLAARLTDRVIRLDPTAEDKRQARGTLLRLLGAHIDGYETARLTDTVIWLDPTAEDKRQARGALLRLLAGQADAPLAARLTDTVIRLDPTAEDRRQARDALVGLLAGQTGGTGTADLASQIVRLATTAQDKQQARGELLGLLAGQVSGSEAAGLAAGMVQLAVTTEDKRQVCGALLRLLTGQTDGWAIAELLGGVVQLDPTAEDKRRARAVLLELLAGQTGSSLAERLVDTLAQLDPTAHDLTTWRGWQIPPTAELLAAVRRNSALPDWLAILRSLAALSVSLQ